MPWMAEYTGKNPNVSCQDFSAGAGEPVQVGSSVLEPYEFKRACAVFYHYFEQPFATGIEPFFSTRDHPAPDENRLPLPGLTDRSDSGPVFVVQGCEKQEIQNGVKPLLGQEHSPLGAHALQLCEGKGEVLGLLEVGLLFARHELSHTEIEKTWF